MGSAPASNIATWQGPSRVGIELESPFDDNAPVGQRHHVCVAYEGCSRFAKFVDGVLDTILFVSDLLPGALEFFQLLREDVFLGSLHCAPPEALAWLEPYGAGSSSLPGLWLQSPT